MCVCITSILRLQNRDCYKKFKKKEIKLMLVSFFHFSMGSVLGGGEFHHDLSDTVLLK